MRVPIVAGNWKMHGTIQESVDLVREMRRGLNEIQGVEKVIVPRYKRTSLVSFVPQHFGYEIERQVVS